MKKISLVFACSILVTTASIAAGQNVPRPEVSFGYTYVHSNAPVGGCGCFAWQGGSAAVNWGIAPRLSVAGSFEGFHASPYSASALSPTMLMFLAGLRYDIVSSKTHRIVPFANAQLGGAYAYNGYFVTTNSESALAMKLGGGVSINLNERWSIRPVEANYLWTHFKNAANDRQNNIELTTGIAYRFHTH